MCTSELQCNGSWALITDSVPACSVSIPKRQRKAWNEARLEPVCGGSCPPKFNHYHVFTSLLSPNMSNMQREGCVSSLIMNCAALQTMHESPWRINEHDVSPVPLVFTNHLSNCALI